MAFFTLRLAIFCATGCFRCPCFMNPFSVRSDRIAKRRWVARLVPSHCHRITRGPQPNCGHPPPCFRLRHWLLPVGRALAHFFKEWSLDVCVAEQAEAGGEGGRCILCSQPSPFEHCQRRGDCVALPVGGRLRRLRFWRIRAQPHSH